MKPYLLAPVGRAEPDDVQGWFEQGGAFGLQKALELDVPSLRALVAPWQRRDGLGTIANSKWRMANGLQSDNTSALIHAQINLLILPTPHPVRYLVEEIPSYLLEGALIWARLCGQASVTLTLINATRTHRELLKAVIDQFKAISIIGPGGWSGVTQVDVVTGSQLLEMPYLDGVTTTLLPIALREGHDLPTSLLGVMGGGVSPAVHEIELGLKLRDLLFRRLGSIIVKDTLTLGTRTLTHTNWDTPLDFAHFGTDLAGVLRL